MIATLTLGFLLAASPEAEDFANYCRRFRELEAGRSPLQAGGKPYQRHEWSTKAATVVLDRDQPTPTGVTWLRQLANGDPMDHLMLIEDAAAELDVRFDCPTFRIWSRRHDVETRQAWAQASTRLVHELCEAVGRDASGLPLAEQAANAAELLRSRGADLVVARDLHETLRGRTVEDQGIALDAFLARWGGGGRCPGLQPLAAPSPRVAIARAIPVANAALDKAYATSLRRVGAPKQAHLGPWVSDEEAKVEGDVERGWTVTWSSHPPAGYEYDVTVNVRPDGAVRAGKAQAWYADH